MTSKNIILEDDYHCFICGKNNPFGLQLEFSFHNGKVISEFVLKKAHQGYKDIIHGGIISAILDEAMVKTALLQNMPAVTAEITIRFHNPLMVDEHALVEAFIEKNKKKIIETRSEIRKTDNTIIAEGYAKLIRV